MRRHAMEWIDKHKNMGRVPVLVLLLLAIGGPWFFTLDGVPPPEWCRDPFFLLSNGRCAGSVSAAEILAFVGLAGKHNDRERRREQNGEGQVNPTPVDLADARSFCQPGAAFIVAAIEAHP